jgi:oligosaccharide 4-alpha-D-glucosyltransferase
MKCRYISGSASYISLTFRLKNSPKPFLSFFMKKTFLTCWILLLCSLFLQAQVVDCCREEKQNAETVRLASENGDWFFSSPADGIIKAVYRPARYWRSENISNAVILPPGIQPITIKIGNDTLISYSKSTAVRISGGKISFAFSGQEVSSLHSAFEHADFRGFRFALKPGEQLYGGGERAIPMNRRGYRFNFYNQPAYGYGEGAENLNFSVPFLISSDGYGIFFDNVSKGYADIGKTNPGILEAGFYSGELNLYVIAGKNVAEIVGRFAKLTGTQDIPPRWALGAFISRFGYQSEEQADSVVNKMLGEKFPCDAIIFDLFWFGDSIKRTLGNLDWMNKQRWPNPEKMISDYRSQGIKTVLITEPFVLNTTPAYAPTLHLQAVDSSGKPFVLTQFYFGVGGLLDLFRNDAQDWFWQAYHRQIKIGVAGWWGDLGEPENHPAALHHNLKDLGFSRLFSADEVHNLYGQYWSKMLSDHYAEFYPDVRLFHLNRAGFAGSQRYQAFPWTGDVGRNWSGLRAQLPVLLGTSISGIPYVHSDAGGFAMGEKDPELFTRWVQFAVFTPIFRPHGTALEKLEPSVNSIESEPVFYPEPYKSILRNYYHLRYALGPYNYTLAYEQQQSGKPLMRPMFYYSTADTNLLRAGDQYFWGDQLLIAPVTGPGATERKIYLPEGNWYEWSRSTATAGSKWITVPVDISHIPVYVKAGSFIPTVDSLVNMDRYDGKNLHVLYYYSPDPSSFTMYDDDGKTNQSWVKNQFELITFSSARKGSKQVIEIHSNGGNYPGKPAERTYALTLSGLPEKPKQVKLDSADVTGQITWDELNGLCKVVINQKNTPSKLELKY